MREEQSRRVKLTVTLLAPPYDGKRRSQKLIKAEVLYMLQPFAPKAVQIDELEDKKRAKK